MLVQSETEMKAKREICLEVLVEQVTQVMFEEGQEE